MEKMSAPKKLTAEISKSLLSFVKRRGDIAVPNQVIFGQECDVLGVGKDGELTDYEIKVRMENLIQDFTKRKHKKPIVNYMYFVVPEYLFCDCVNRIPQKYGVIMYRNETGRCHKFRVMRTAERLKEEVTQIDYKSICVSLSSRIKTVLADRKAQRLYRERARKELDEYKQEYEKVVSDKFSTKNIFAGDRIKNKTTGKMFSISGIEFDFLGIASAFLVRDNGKKASVPFDEIEDYEIVK